MIVFDIDLRLFKACNVIAPKTEARFYLQGVCVQAIKGQVFLIATDGHRLLCFKPEITVNDDFSVIIPRQFIQDIKLNKGTSIAELTVDGQNVTFKYCGLTMTTACIDGTFPAWQRVMPKTISGEVAQFNPLYLADFIKVLKELDSKSTQVSIGHNGGSPAIVGLDIDIDYMALIMPTRMQAPNFVPAWCYGGETQAQAA